MTPDALARACADAMLVEDRAIRGLGISLDKVGPGHASVSMTVTETMLNSHGICHGGFIFALADTAFAYACNSHGQSAVAQHNSITFLRPGRLGERLTAEATERSRTARSGIYDVRVTGADGGAVAELRGHSRLIGGRLVPRREG